MVQLTPLHPETTYSLASFKSRLVLPFWCQLTQLVLDKMPLNGCSSSSKNTDPIVRLHTDIVQSFSVCLEPGAFGSSEDLVAMLQQVCRLVGLQLRHTKLLLLSLSVLD